MFKASQLPRRWMPGPSCDFESLAMSRPLPCQPGRPSVAVRWPGSVQRPEVLCPSTSVCIVDPRSNRWFDIGGVRDHTAATEWMRVSGRVMVIDRAARGNHQQCARPAGNVSQVFVRFNPTSTPPGVLFRTGLSRPSSCKARQHPSGTRASPPRVTQASHPLQPARRHISTYAPRPEQSAFPCPVSYPPRTTRHPGSQASIYRPPSLLFPVQKNTQDSQGTGLGKGVWPRQDENMTQKDK